MDAALLQQQQRNPKSERQRLLETVRGLQRELTLAFEREAKSEVGCTADLVAIDFRYGFYFECAGGHWDRTVSRSPCAVTHNAKRMTQSWLSNQPVFWLNWLYTCLQPGRLVAGVGQQSTAGACQ